MKNIGLLLLSFVLLACNPENAGSIQHEENTSLTPPQRIVTLAPHLTELIYTLGAQDRLVGTVEYSDYPAAAESITRVGNAFQLDWETLTALEPDLIIAWQGGNPDTMLDKLDTQGYHLLRLENASLDSLPEQLIQLNDVVKGAAGLDEQLQSYLNGLSELRIANQDKSVVKVFYQISTEPVYTVDSTHSISDMLSLCGAENVFSVLGRTSAPVTPEAVVAAAPDVILTTSHTHATVVSLWDGIFAQPDILSIPADEVSRASLRMLEGVENICTVLDTWRSSKTE